MQTTTSPAHASQREANYHEYGACLNLVIQPSRRWLIKMEEALNCIMFFEDQLVGDKYQTVLLDA